MSREIDERIVAMYFDNRNFESGAQQTLKTLEQLKQSCNMEGVGKGFEAIEEVTKKLKLEKVVQGASKVKSVFNDVGNVIKKAFSLTPFDNMLNAINNFRHNFLDKIIGFDFAGKIASSIENAFRSLTIAPVSAGWTQYENTMDSVKTIISSTGESIDVVKGKLKEMTDYANLTIYSLNDMTSNLGKFTNAGVPLDDATNAMIGLANATADAGQGAQQASMAMYNVSQAIGVGKMTTIDWKSLENANIATQKLKRTFIQAAVASGTLEEKVVKVTDATTGLEKEETQYWTKAEKGAKAEQVTAENFRETLNKGWLSKKAMLDTFAIYSGQMNISDIASMGFSQKQAEELYEIGQAALKAAQEVRTFSKMMDAMRESVQSSWATSFEFIFGDMEEGTNLWTALNEKIDAVLTKGAESRNRILMSWRGMMKDEGGQVRKIEEVYKHRKQALDYNLEHHLISVETYQKQLDELNKGIGNTDLWVDYREVAIDTLMDLIDLIKMVGGQIKAAWTGVFGYVTGDTLKGITNRFRAFITTIKDWLGSSEDAESQISKLRKGLSGVFNVLKIGISMLKSVVSVSWNFIKPFIDPILNLFSMFGQAIDLSGAENLGDIIKKLSEKFKGLVKTLKEVGFSGVFEKVGNWFSDIWTKIKSGVREWLSNNGFEGVIDWFRNIRSKIEEGVTAVKEWWNNPENNIAGFFKKIYESVTGWFKSGVDDRGNEIRSPIAQFFYRIRNDVDNAFKAIGEWWDGSGIPDFFQRIWTEVTGWFKPGVDDRGNEVRSPIAQFFYRIRNDVDSAFKSVREWWAGSGIPDFFQRIWNEITGLFRTETKKSAMIGTERREWVETGDSPFVKFFKETFEGIKNFWDDGEGGGISNWPIWSKMENFFTQIWDKITGIFKKQDQYDDRGFLLNQKKDSPFVQFFKDAFESIKNFWDDGAGGGLSNWPIWNKIGNFFTQIWDKITGIFKQQDQYDERGFLLNQKKDSPFVQFFKDAFESIKNFWDDGENGGVANWPIWKEIGTFFTGIWDNIASVFRTQEKQVANIPIPGGGFERREWTTTREMPIVTFFKDLWKDIQDIWGEIAGWPGWGEIGKFLENTWNWILGKSGTESSGNSGDVKSGVAAVTDIPLSEGDAKTAEQKVGIMSQIIGTISGFVERVQSFIGEAGFGDAASRFFDALGKVLESVAIIAEHIVNLVHSIVTGNLSAGQIAEIGGIITTLLTLNIFKYRHTSHLAEISSNTTDIGTTLLAMAGGIALIAVAVSIIGKMNPEDLLKGVGVIAVVGLILFVLLQSVNKIGETFNAGFKNQPVTSSERIIKHLITSVTMAGAIAEVMALLPSILEKLQGFDKNTNGDAILKTFEGVALVVGSLIISIGIFNKLSGSNMSVAAAAKGSLSIVVGLSILMVGLDAIIGGLFGLGETLNNLDSKNLGGITEDHISRIKAGGRILSALGEALGGFFGAIGGGLIGGFDRAKGNELAEGSKEAANILKGVSVEDMQHMADVVGVLNDIQSSIPDYDGIWDKWINGDKLGQLGDNVGRLGEGLGRMVVAINPADLDPTNDIARLKGYIDLLSGFGSTMQVLYNSVEQANALFGSNYLGPEVIGSMFETVAPYYREAARLLAEAVQAGLGEEGSAALMGFNFDPTGIIAAICRSLEQQGKTEVAQAVRAMIQFGLDSYGDSSSLGEGALHSTSQITDSLTKLFEIMSGDTTQLGLESVLTNLLGDLGDSGKLNDLLGQFNFDTLGSAISDKINGSIQLDFAKWTEKDDEGNLVMLKDLETQWQEMMAQFETDEGQGFELQIRPVLNMDGFGAEMLKLRGTFANEMPLTMKAAIDIGDQRLDINDAAIVNEIRSVRTELQVTSAALQRVLWAIDSSLGGKINGVTSAVSRLKLNVSLKQIDDGLGRSAANSDLTGVSAPWDVNLAPPHAIP